MIYLAGPYSHEDPEVMQERYEELTRIAAHFMALGECVYSPITHNHVIATKYELPHTWDFWKDLDLPFVKACSKLYVVRLPGWMMSTGVRAEMELAAVLNKPIYYVYPEDLEVHQQVPALALASVSLEQRKDKITL